MPADVNESTYLPVPSRRQSPSQTRARAADKVAPLTGHETRKIDPQSATKTKEIPTPTPPRRDLSNRGSPAAEERRLITVTREKRPDRPSRPEHILVVDDEYWISEMIHEHLSLEGFKTTATTDSAKVMDLLEHDTYDLVIMDIYMPPPDGLTLLTQIREKYPFLAVIMLTAFSDADTASTAMREGAYDYIVKPHQTSQLVSRIERAMERSQLLRERAQTQQILKQRVAEQTRKLRVQSKQLSQMLERVLLTYRATLKALEAALDVRDQSAPGHCRRVAKLAVQLGTRMGLSSEELVSLEHGALLHDIGKLGIPDTILMKPGRLTDEEWATMRRHPEIGCDIVGHIGFLQDALPIIRYHHERYDGSGYPEGLKGDNIPLLARIFTLADSFDAMTNQRPYNTVCSIKDVLEALHRDRGRQFDPQIVNTFIAMLEERDLA